MKGVRYKKDYWPIWASLKVTLICSGILIAGILFCDAVSAPIQSGAGLSPDQINESSNHQLFASIGGFVFLIPVVIFLFGYVMICYLHHSYAPDVTGHWLYIQYKKDRNGKKIPADEVSRLRLETGELINKLK